MQLTVTGKKLDVGDALRARIEEGLGEAVAKYFDQPGDGTVTVSREGHTFRIDIQVHISKRIVVQGVGQAADAYAAFEEALEHVSKRLRRYKRRLKDHKHVSAEREVLQAQQYVISPEADDSDVEPAETGDQPAIVAEMPAEIETLSVSEAVMRLDLAGAPAMLFRSSKHGGLNMVYVREDGNIGWVDPQIPAADES